MADRINFNFPIRITLDEGNTLYVLERLKRHLLQPRGLIAMPTETVYGLAANGLCEESVRHIFTVKGRPLTDPVILHLPNFVDALETIFDTSLFDAFLVLLMANRFAPGPLTIITRGKSTIPAIVSANTMFPAVRCPSHAVAQMLLKYVGIPLAAPSANKFGHISPTRASHVMSEFEDIRLLVLDAGECHLGVESTVVKVEPSDDTLNANDFLREHGTNYGVLADIVAALDLETLCDPISLNTAVVRLSRGRSVSANLIRAFVDHINAFRERCHRITILRRGFITEGDLQTLFKPSVFPKLEIVCKDMFLGVKEVCQTPGALLTHYAPSVPTYMIGEPTVQPVATISTALIVMIDVGGEFRLCAESFLRYFWMERDDEIVAHELYSRLRDAEKTALWYNKYVRSSSDDPDVDNPSAVIVVNHQQRNCYLNATVRDRLIRACSGKIVQFRFEDDNIMFMA